MKGIGEKIRKIRELRNISRKYMAFELKISGNTYGKIERDEVDITLRRLDQISKLLNLRMSTLIEFDESKILDQATNKRQRK